MTNTAEQEGHFVLLLRHVFIAQNDGLEKLETYLIAFAYFVYDNYKKTRIFVIQAKGFQRFRDLQINVIQPDDQK